MRDGAQEIIEKLILRRKVRVMSLEVETIVAVSVMMAVFSAVAAVGTSIVLGAGFERLRCGFEVVRKQTGFFSDAIHKLEQKVEEVDGHTASFSHAIAVMESKVSNVGEQANAFGESMQMMARKVEVVDKQTSFFSDSLHRLEQKVEAVSAHEELISDRLQANADSDVLSIGKTEALVSHAESLLSQIGILAEKMSENRGEAQISEQKSAMMSVPSDKLMHFMHQNQSDGGVRYN